MSATVEKRDRSTGSQFPIAKQDGLDLTVQGGNLNHANNMVVVAPAVLTLTDDTINYVFIDWTDDTIKTNTTGFASLSTELHKVTTASGVITSIEDCRSVLRVSAHTECKTRATSLLTGSETVDTGWVDQDISADLPTGATGVFLSVGVQDSGTPSNGVYIAFRKKGETETSRQQAVRPQVSGVLNTRAIPVGVDTNGKFEMRVLPSGTMDYQIDRVGFLYGDGGS